MFSAGLTGLGWLLIGVSSSWGLDWGQHRGPATDGTSPENILTSWPAEGLREIWRVPLTDGFSTFTVTQGKVFSQVVRNIDGENKEVCIALDAKTGQELWSRALELALYTSGGDTAGGGDGPRSTPTADGDRVYVCTSWLKLFCLDASDGHVVWQKNFVDEYGATVIGWQSAASPLIEGDCVYVNGNASPERMFCLRKADGTVVWRKHNDRLTHATPVAATLQGVRQIIFNTQSGLVSVAPLTGDLLWRYTFPYNTSAGASPVVGGDMVYCSAGYGVGAGAVRISLNNGQFTAAEIWRKSGKLMNHWSTPVYCQGYLYGLYGYADYDGAPLKCVEMATGREMWSVNGFGQGGTILVNGHVLVLSADGQLVLIKTNPDAYQEEARWRAFNAKCWNNAAYSNGKIYARSISEGVSLQAAPPAMPAPLRLQSSLPQSGDRFQLWIGNADHSAVDPGRAAQIEIRVSGDLTADPSAWVKLDRPLVATNGLLCVEDAGIGLWPQRFYKVMETP